MESFLLVVFLIISCASLAFSASWSYESPNGPANWTGVCKNGTRQSPIDIKSSEAVYDEALGKFELKNYDKQLTLDFTVANNGHGMVVSLGGGDYAVSGGGLDGSYKTVQFHLHWGPDENAGSEHEMDGKAYPAEMHFVSMNTKYSTLKEALTPSDGLAVLGVFMEVGGDDNFAWSFLDYAANVTTFNTSVVVPASKFAVFNNLLPASKTDYYRYDGSLTTPTCNEVVTWTVFKNTVKISQRQIDLLRKLKQKDGKLLTENYRPPTPLNGRTVKASFKATSVATTPPPAAGSTIMPTGGASVSRMTAGLFLSMLLVLFALQ
ncbi:carbonic anhydrase 7-like [Porites lutea]|uniref:carbonic anhydrase 7-like n=1 Tax=Porites lutea TaxID=51062 RepID=UPI003CC6951D